MGHRGAVDDHIGAEGVKGGAYHVGVGDVHRGEVLSGGGVRAVPSVSQPAARHWRTISAPSKPVAPVISTRISYPQNTLPSVASPIATR
jgi:hypothetical protein